MRCASSRLPLRPLAPLERSERAWPCINPGLRCCAPSEVAPRGRAERLLHAARSAVVAESIVSHHRESPRASGLSRRPPVSSAGAAGWESPHDFPTKRWCCRACWRAKRMSCHKRRAYSRNRRRAARRSSSHALSLCCRNEIIDVLKALASSFRPTCREQFRVFCATPSRKRQATPVTRPLLRCVWELFG